MDKKALNAVLLSLGAVAVVYSLLTRSLLVGVLIVLFLFVVSLLYRAVVALERIADDVGRLATTTADDGRSGSGHRRSGHRSSGADRDDEERPPAEERDPDELFE